MEFDRGWPEGMGMGQWGVSISVGRGRAPVLGMRIRFLRYAVLSLALTLVIACAQLPEYAKPHSVPIDEIKKGMPDGFTYRQLGPEDFRATSLPENLSTHEKTINARATTQIRITADSNFSITPCLVLDQMNYCARIDHLAFEAVMIPDSSWWNPKIKPAMKSYVLQHEQIHFGLTELAARKLTSDARKWASNSSIIKETPQQVYSEIFQQVKAMINSAMEANQKRHLKFDEHTSLFYSPSWQAWWFETVEKELKQTESDTKGR